MCQNPPAVVVMEESLSAAGSKSRSKRRVEFSRAGQRVLQTLTPGINKKRRPMLEGGCLVSSTVFSWFPVQFLCLSNISSREEDRLPRGTGYLARLHHLLVLLLEALAKALGGLHPLVDAAHDAALLALLEGLAGEVGDAVVEAALDKIRVCLFHVLSAIDACCSAGRSIKASSPTYCPVRYSHEKSRSYIHKLLHLLLLHARLQLALLRLGETRCIVSATISSANYDWYGIAYAAFIFV